MMIRIILISAAIFLIVLFIYQLRNYLARDKKIEELKESRLETDLMDIDKEIAEEKAHQKDIASEIDEIKSQPKNDNKDTDK
ncbi:MAG: hypothetical protein ACI93R_000408 [Flavobacteriales bacterium]|jgi:hypothetical protein